MPVQRWVPRYSLCYNIMMKYLLTATLISILVPATAAAQNLDVPSIIAGLAQPAQTNTDFAEARFSPLLKAPVVVSGVLGYGGPQALDRHVLVPYLEDTEIRSDTIRVNREGEAERTFALGRAPELQGLLHAFSALLSGDHAAIEHDFTIEASGTAEQWTLHLIPRDRKIRQRIRDIRIDGQRTVPQCFWMDRDSESFSVMLLGVVAHIELPEPLTRDWLQTRCAE
ncbi:MAG: LolA-related protein [Pseudomonadota bacterium]